MSFYICTIRHQNQVAEKDRNKLGVEWNHGIVLKPNNDLSTTDQFDLNNSIERMNSRYKKSLNSCKLNQNQTLQKLSPTGLGSFYGKYIKQNSTRKRIVQRQNEIFIRKADKTIRYSRLCISIAVTFFVLTTPANVPLISYPINGAPFDWYKGVYVSISNFLEILNYCCNFFVYCIANTTIREVAMNDITCCIQYLTSIVQKFRSFFKF